MKGRARIASVASLALLLIAGGWLTFGRSKEVQYKGKSVSEWFYGQRRDFFYQSTRQAADEAFKSLGTNCLPFLLSALRERGNSGFYFQFFRRMPAQIQTLLQYPISRDDIQMMALDHLYKIPNVPNTIPEPWLAQLGREVPDLRNARVRQQGLFTLHQLTRYEREPLLPLCRRLLDDPHFGIRLEAALYLADLKIKEPRTIPILIAALEDEEKIASYVAIHSYSFGHPPGGAGMPPRRLPVAGQASFPDPRRNCIGNILDALGRSEPELDEGQRGLVHRAKKQRLNENAGDAATK